ncbi:hypothetical protein KSF78_0007517 [Schistosoma japonicum]|nr:hypothetical protein KSF78_0007517 [Schistosoma japonicum]
MVHEFWLLVITIFINVVVDQSSATNTTTPSSETNTPSTEIMSLFQKITLEDFFKFMPKPLQNEIFVKDCQNMNSETLQRLRNEYHKNKAQTETHTKQPTTRDSETLQRLRNEYHKNKSQTETHTRQPTTRGEQCRLM